MKARFFPDLICILLSILFIPFLVMQSSPPRNPTATPKSLRAAKVPEKPAPKDAAGKLSSLPVIPEEKAYGSIDTRNVFAPDGTYRKLASKQPHTTKEAMFRLLGVTNTGVMTGLIVDPDGAVRLVKKGDTFDGVAVKNVGNTSVKLVIGNKDVELRLFDVRVDEKKIPKSEEKRDARKKG